MSGTQFAFEHVRQRSLFHECRAVGSIYFVDRWTKQKIDAKIPAKFLVLFFGSRITLVIAARFELKRINEDADCNFAMFAGRLARHPDQLAMGLVQRAHCWNQHTRLSLPLRTYRRDRGQNFHAGSFIQRSPLCESRNSMRSDTRNQKNRINAPVIISASIQAKSMLNHARRSIATPSFS